MKLKISLFLSLVAFAFVANAQVAPSKEVQKVANKSWLNDEAYTASHVTASSAGIPAVAISKGIHAKSASVAEKGNIVSKGTPDWVVSKGVHRVGRK